MFLSGYSLIDGKSVASSSEPFRAINPDTGASLAPDYFGASAADIAAACTQAGAAFHVYRRTSGAERAAFLSRIAHEIEALGAVLTERFVAETGLPLARAQGETARTCAQLRMFADLVTEGSWIDARIDRALPNRTPLPRPDLRSMLCPIGPIAIFGPANFPLAFDAAGGDAASALAAGCPVVVKAHSSHPGTAELVGHAISRAVQAQGLPSGIFSLLYGKGAVAGSAIVEHPAIKGVGFTGSQHAGLHLREICNRRAEPIPFFGELSSLNPVFLLPTALANRAQDLAQELYSSITLGNGQFCTNPGLVFYIRGQGAEELTTRLCALLKAVPPAPMLSAATAKSYHESISRIADQTGINLLTGNKPIRARESARSQPALFQTTAALFRANPALQSEMFGAASLLVACDDLDEMIQAAAVLKGQLTTTFHEAGADLEFAATLVTQATDRAGRVIFNGYPTGVEVCPAIVHGGPWPATTDNRFTSVGTAAIRRWVRPVCWQNAPANALPPELANKNPLGLMRLMDGTLTRSSL